VPADFIAVGVPIMLREPPSSVVLVVGKEKSVLFETALRRRVSNYALIVPRFLAIHFCKVLSVCLSDAYYKLKKELVRSEKKDKVRYLWLSLADYPVYQITFRIKELDI